MTMRGYLKSSPHFFRRIKIALVLFGVILLVSAALIPAPLQEPGTMARVPNPVKSAWFLLWIQELVSHSKYLIYLVLALAVGFFLLPWLPGAPSAERAAWWQKERLAVNLLSLLAVILMIALTVLAMFFRGENWRLSLTF
jgi:lysylphosphatidylglycerol synthetase-like protein (DUF2156 family)